MELVEFGEASDATAGDELERGEVAAEFLVELEGAALEAAVAGDIGTDDLAYAFALIVGYKVVELEFGLFLPSAYGNLSVFDIGTEDNFIAAIGLEPLGGEGFVFYGDAAHSNLTSAAVEGELYGVVVFNTTAKVYF